jgi:hypothetical protein
MHTVALASNGSIFTWGCNDEGALGRTGAENTPIRVEGLPAVTDISAGDSHTIAYNTSSNQVFYWGCYRVSHLFSFKYSASNNSLSYFFKSYFGHKQLLIFLIFDFHNLNIIERTKRQDLLQTRQAIRAGHHPLEQEFKTEDKKGRQWITPYSCPDSMWQSLWLGRR